MSAAFALDFSGPPVPCDYPRCVLEAFHAGDHAFPKPALVRHFDQHCVVCGQPFTVYAPDGFPKHEFNRTCGSQDCLLHLARHDSEALDVRCTCPQRPYPHELSIHTLIRHEWWKKELRTSWPWSLMASVREEPSTERKAAE